MMDHRTTSLIEQSLLLSINTIQILGPFTSTKISHWISPEASFQCSEQSIPPLLTLLLRFAQEVVIAMQVTPFSQLLTMHGIVPPSLVVEWCLAWQLFCCKQLMSEFSKRTAVSCFMMFQSRPCVMCHIISL